MKSNRYNKIWHESNGFKKRVSFTSVQVSPQLAQELLELNNSNRPVRSSHVKKLSEDIQNNKWIENGDSIRISKEGKLLDGQHRLHAIIASGMAISQDIITGLDPQSFSTMDVGRKRSKGDTLAVAGIKNYVAMANCIDYLISYKINGDINSTNRKVNTNEDAVAYLELLRENGDINFVESEVKEAWNRSRKMKIISPGGWAFIGCILKEISPQDGDEFLNLLVSGDGISSGDSTSAIFLLRRKFIDMLQTSSGKARYSFSYKLAHIFKAWNYYRQRKIVKQLSWDDRQDFPKPI